MKTKIHLLRVLGFAALWAALPACTTKVVEVREPTVTTTTTEETTTVHHPVTGVTETRTVRY